MTKSELKDGMYVKINGRLYFVYNGNCMDIGENYNLSNYNDDLTHASNSKYDINAVYTSNVDYLNFTEDFKTCIWTREITHTPMVGDMYSDEDEKILIFDYVDNAYYPFRCVRIGDNNFNNIEPHSELEMTLYKFVKSCIGEAAQFKSSLDAIRRIDIND